MTQIIIAVSLSWRECCSLSTPLEHHLSPAGNLKSTQLPLLWHRVASTNKKKLHFLNFLPVLWPWTTNAETFCIFHTSTVLCRKSHPIRSIECRKYEWPNQSFRPWSNHLDHGVSTCVLHDPDTFFTQEKWKLCWLLLIGKSDSSMRQFESFFLFERDQVEIRDQPLCCVNCLARRTQTLIGSSRDTTLDWSWQLRTSSRLVSKCNISIC